MQFKAQVLVSGTVIGRKRGEMFNQHTPRHQGIHFEGNNLYTTLFCSFIVGKKINAIACKKQIRFCFLCTEAKRVKNASC